ncbi:MAG: diacylglycerol/polyprenol kinase family protein [Promethearchaeota archaeon]
MVYTIDLLLMDLMLMGIGYAYVFAMILIPVGLKKKDKISKYTARKMVHLFAGLVVMIVPYFNWPYFAIIIAGSLTVVTFLSQKDSSVKALKDLYEAIGEEAEEKSGYLQGPFHYCLSITSLVTIFVIIAPDQMYFPIAGILLMIISDTVASMVGKKIGKHIINLSWTSTTRTIEGSLAFFISAFLLCLFAFMFFGLINPLNQRPLNLETVLIYSLITSALATVIELISPSTWDDLTVPIASTLIIFLLTLI